MATHRFIFFLFPIGVVVGAVLSIVIAARYKEVRQALGWKLIPPLPDGYSRATGRRARPTVAYR